MFKKNTKETAIDNNDPLSYQKQRIQEQQKLANLVLIEEALIKSMHINSFFLFQKEGERHQKSYSSIRQKIHSINPSRTSVRVEHYRTKSNISSKARYGPY